MSVVSLTRSIVAIRGCRTYGPIIELLTDEDRSLQAHRTTHTDLRIEVNHWLGFSRLAAVGWLYVICWAVESATLQRLYVRNLYGYWFILKSSSSCSGFYTLEVD